MSHEATNWAFKVPNLKPGPRVVLLYLADCHNPHYGCFPHQERLAKDCYISRASLNKHLDHLEERGLIRREQRVNRQTNRQQATRYHFAFEAGFTPCPETGLGKQAGATGEQGDEKPCPDSGHGRVDNPVGNSTEPCPAFDKKPCPDSGHITSKLEPVRSFDESGGQELTNVERSHLQNELRVLRRHRANTTGPTFTELLDRQIADIEGKLGIEPTTSNEAAA